MKFEELNIIEPILKALKEEQYEKPTLIQEKAIPELLKKRDVLGSAQTGTGKTAAFSIPILQQLYNDNVVQNKPRKIKALVITPTRELAIQISDSFTSYGKYTGIKNAVIFGGVKQVSQTATLNKGVDILVATPGRLLDLMNQGLVKLDDIQYFVLMKRIECWIWALLMISVRSSQNYPLKDSRYSFQRRCQIQSSAYPKKY